MKASVLMAGLVAGIIFQALPATGAEQTDYIDRIKAKWRREGKPTGPVNEGIEPYIENQRKLLKTDLNSTESTESYVDKLKRAHPENFRKDGESVSYTEQEKAKLEHREVGGAIQAFNEGKSELKAKKFGTARNAIAIRYGASINRDLAPLAGVQARSFSDVYPGYAPDISFLYEYRAFQHKWLGSLGFLAIGGITYFQGVGRTAGTGTALGNQSLGSPTKFQFFLLPAVVAARYQFTGLHYVRPFVSVGGAAVGYVETRNDKNPSHKGHTEGFFGSAGVNILLDWIAPRSAWDLYTFMGVQYYYLTVEYSMITTVTEDIKMNISGLTAGITFEY